MKSVKHGMRIAELNKSKLFSREYFRQKQTRSNMMRRLVLALFLTPLMSMLAQDRHVTVRVIPPASTPADAAIFIAGNSPALGNWDPGKVRLKK